MEVTITQFRRDIFELINQALEGKDIWVTHKGRRIKVVPEVQPGSRLSRITPLALINPAGRSSKRSDRLLQEEMARAWEQDWSTL
ncbi:MAG TPA: type II toxin-antitoxin system prevent-host-death family antitoxin [Acidobacteriaceae bacterium]|nr:type II toxin-antitoxin system prevent-host-death family antitoxin [Acidobacteriaceae bacterium]